MLAVFIELGVALFIENFVVERVPRNIVLPDRDGLPFGVALEVVRLEADGARIDLPDFPQPDSPTTPTVEPCGISKETPLTAFTTPWSVKK